MKIDTKKIKKIMILMIVFTISVSAFARMGDTKQEKIERKVHRARVLLKKIERNYISCINYNDRREAIRKMDKVMKILDRIENMEKEREHKKKYKPKAMSRREFSKYYRVLKKHTFADKQIKYISLTAYKKNFSINQLIKIMKIFPFDGEKLLATRYIYPVVVDKHRSYLLFRHMTHNSNMDKLERILIKNQ